MQLPVGFDYVLVLEWLRAGDQPTGSQLHGFLQSIGFRSDLVVCQTWEDVQQALMPPATLPTLRGFP